MGNKLGRGWAAKLAAAVFGLGVLGTAPAAVYVGTFDPQFGAPFTSPPGPFNLGWRGEVTLDFAAACITPGTIVQTGSGACAASGGAQMLTAWVELYDFSAPAGASQRLTIDPLSMDIFALQFDVSGNLVHLDTSRSDTVSGNPFVSGFPGGPYFFGLGFVISDDLCDGVPACVLTNPPLYSGAVLGYQNFADACGESCILADVRRFPPTLVFAPVSEPAGLALSLLALTAAGAVTNRTRRRRR